MCVILIAQQVRITEEVVRAAFAANPDGAGLAYRDGGKVKWRKGFSLDEIIKENAALPLPYILHFRISTIGGRALDLTHPFPVDPQVSTDIEGETKTGVLFHNGHWNEWRRETYDAAKQYRIKLPRGRWSDTRGLAFVAALRGLGALDMIDQRVVVLSPGDLDFFGDGWVWEKEGEFWASNRSYQPRVVHGYALPEHYRQIGIVTVPSNKADIPAASLHAEAAPSTPAVEVPATGSFRVLPPPARRAAAHEGAVEADPGDVSEGEGCGGARHGDPHRAEQAAQLAWARSLNAKGITRLGRL